MALLYLVTRAGGGEEDAWDRAGEGGGLAWLTKVAQGRDSRDRDLFLAKASLGVSDKEGESGVLGESHCGGVKK